MQRTRWSLLSQAVIAALTLATPGFAQEAPPAEVPAPAATPADREIEEIIVTATKREANIQEVPIAVSAFQAEELSARRIDEIEDLAQVSPSIHVNTSNTSSAGGTLRIRGVGTTGNNIGLEAAVGTFIDGVYRSRSGQGFNDLLDIERIEVLRGPQGTLFGKNTSAGAISVVTKRPVLSGTEAWISGEYGSFDHRKLSASVSGPIVEETLGFRLSATWNRRDGYYENLHSSSDSDDAAIRDRWTLRGQLLYAPNEDLDFRFIADFTQRDESCCPALLVRGGGTIGRVLTAAQARGLGEDVAVDSSGAAVRGPDVSHRSGRRWHVGFNSEPFEEVKDGGISLEANWDLDWTKLTSLTSWRSFRADYAQDIDFTSAEVLHPQDPNGGGAFDDFETFSQEIRAQGVAFDQLDWLFGFYGYTEDVETHTKIEWGADAPFVIAGVAIPSLLPEGTGYERDAFIDTSGWALFTNNTWHPWDRLDLTIGARYSKETKEAGSVVNGAPNFEFANAQHCQTGIFINSFCNNLSWSDSGVTEKEWTYTFSGTFHLTEDVNLYYSYSRGYKAGGFNTDQDSFDCAIFDGPDADTVATALTPRPLTGVCAGLGAGPDPLNPDLTVPINNTKFDPEFAKSHELGIKTTFLDGRARVNFTLFTTDFTDFQLNTFTGLGFIVSNADKARSRGGELESFFAPIEGMTLTLGVTYADARYDDDSIQFDLVNPWPAPQDGLPCVNNPAGGPTDCDFFIDHRRLTNAPAWTGSSAISYEHALPGSEWVAFGTVNATYRGRHSTGSNLHPYKFEDAHWFGNLNFGIRSPEGHWEASVWSTNFTDTFDRSIIFDTPTQSGTFHAFAGPPRMWGGTIKYTF
jgi:outer membrane receptor protein involved in Fe transport